MVEILVAIEHLLIYLIYYYLNSHNKRVNSYPNKEYQILKLENINVQYGSTINN